MGIKNLMKLLTSKSPDAIYEIQNSELKNKKVAIDTSIILYQFITAIRSSGADLKNKEGKSTSHIHGILIKTLNCLKVGIIPVHIFDGKPPELKMKILNDRMKIKKNALSKLDEIQHQEKDKKEEKYKEEKEEKIKLLKMSVSISQEEMLEAIEIVNLLGVPVINAPEEADSQCAYLSVNNLVDYVASEDMDLLTFGTKKLLKNFMKKTMYCVDLDDILNQGEITMDQFIDLCILLGCDYTDTISGIGLKRAWDIIKKYKSLNKFIEKDPKIASNTYVLPNNFRYEESREYFKNPRHTDEFELNLSVPKLDELKMLLINKYNFDEEHIEKLIGFLRKTHNLYDQTNYVNDPFIDDDMKVSKKKVKNINKYK